MTKKRKGKKKRKENNVPDITDTETNMTLIPALPRQAFEEQQEDKKQSTEKKKKSYVKRKRPLAVPKVSKQTPLPKKIKEMTPAKKRKLELKQKLLQEELEAKARQLEASQHNQRDPLEIIQEELATLQKEKKTLTKRENIRRRIQVDQRIQELEKKAKNVATAVVTREETEDQIKLKQYIENLNQPPEFSDQDVCLNTDCPFYKIQKLILKVDEGKVVCPKCARLRDYLPSTSSSLPFGEDVEVVQHMYHREKHFKLFLNQFRAGIIEVPDHVIRIVRAEFSKVHVMTVSEIKPTKVREILKAKGLSEWADYANRIANRLNGTPIPEFSDKQIVILLHMYHMVQEPFAHLKIPTRDNFMNTTYLMRQFCEILGWKEIKKCFPNPKSPHVCEEQDTMMRRVCAYVGWPFSRSF